MSLADCYTLSKDLSLANAPYRQLLAFLYFESRSW